MSTTTTPETTPRCYALVPCAGVGERAGVGGPKQYHPVAGRPMVAHTLAALAEVSALAQTLVVLSPEDEQFERLVPGFDGWVARCGGATRAASVAAGLQALLARGAQPHDWVLVHDAARCLLQPVWVERLIQACAHDAVGGLLALPVADTLKQETEGRASGTVDRLGKWAAQTPQMFRIGLLQTGLAQAGRAVTDEASAIEALGHAPVLVRGDLENVKVTWPSDFDLAERLLTLRGDGRPSAQPGLAEATAALHVMELRLLDPTHHGDATLADVLASDFVELAQDGYRHGRDEVGALVGLGGPPLLPHLRLRGADAGAGRLRHPLPGAPPGRGGRAFQRLAQRLVAPGRWPLATLVSPRHAHHGAAAALNPPNEPATHPHR